MRAHAHAHAYTHTHAESLLLPELVLCDHSHLFSPSFLDGVCSPCPFCCSFPEFSAFNVMFICMAFIIFNCGGYFFLGGTHGSVLFYLGFFFFLINLKFQSVLLLVRLVPGVRCSDAAFDATPLASLSQEKYLKPFPCPLRSPL